MAGERTHSDKVLMVSTQISTYLKSWSQAFSTPSRKHKAHYAVSAPFHCAPTLCSVSGGHTGMVIDLEPGLLTCCVPFEHAHAGSAEPS